MQIIKATGTITFSAEGNPQEEILIISGSKLNKIKTLTVPITYKPKLLVSDYKPLYSTKKMKWLPPLTHQPYRSALTRRIYRAFFYAFESRKLAKDPV